MTLFAYQQRALEFALTHPRCALWAECGLGKTLVAIEALRRLPSPALVLAPKTVIDHTWPAELKKWAPDLRVVSLAVSPLKRQAAFDTPADVYLLNFELVDKCFGRNGTFAWKFPTLIIDEATKVKNRATALFKALRFNGAKFERLIELTGTPSPNGLEDLWSQVYLLDGGERLGRTLTAFRERWFTAGHLAWHRKPRPSARKEIESRIADICMSLTAADYLDLPPMMEQDIPVELPSSARKQYEVLREELVAQINGAIVSAPTAATLTNKLLQMTSGAMYSDEGETVLTHSAKLDAVAELHESLGGAPLLISYQFKSELTALRKLGAVEMRDDKGNVDRWNAGGIPLFAIHPASAGHGINLQHGGNHIVWTTPTYNLEHYIQTNARLHRTGQRKPVIVHRLVAPDTMDGYALRVLVGKGNVQSALMQALKGA